VIDYLLKPISFERFYRSVLRLHQNQGGRVKTGKKEVTSTLQNENEYVFLKVGHRIQKIAVKDILFIQGMKDYLQIQTLKEKVMTLMNFATLEESLHSDNFVRVHKSYMVAIDKIDHIEKSRIKIGDQIIPISDTYSESFFKALNKLN
jgi:DNA-binding LytR/AlgR family response regulator